MKKLVLALFILVVLMLALSGLAQAQESSPTPTRTARPSVTVIYATFTPESTVDPYPDCTDVEVFSFTADNDYGYIGMIAWVAIFLVGIVAILVSSLFRRGDKK